jgi:predicted peroxiredoxin
MNEQKKENIVYVLTKGAENPEIVLLSFMHAVGSLAMEVDAKLVLMGTAVNLVKKDAAQHVRYEGLKPLDEQMKDFFDMGGQLYVCTPCYKGRGYDEKSDLLEGAQLIAAAFYTQMLLNASAVVSY